jgi:hypothetical protein
MVWRLLQRTAVRRAAVARTNDQEPTMTLSRCIQFHRPDPDEPGRSITLGEALACLQEEAEALLGDPALADAVALDALMRSVGEPRFFIAPDELGDLCEDELALAS